MVSYNKLLDICAGENYTISSRSLLNYIRDFKNFLADQEVDLQYEIRPEIFREAQNPKKPLLPSQKSAIVFFYKIYLRYLLHDENLGLRAVLRVCRLGMYDIRFAKYIDINLISYDYIVEHIKKDIKSHMNIERLLYLPSKTLVDIYSINEHKPLIPDEWWPERLKVYRNYKYDYVRDIWLAENNLSDDEGYKRFLEVIKEVDDGNYSNGPAKRRRDYTEEKFNDVIFSYNMIKEFDDLVSYKVSLVGRDRDKRWGSEETIKTSLNRIKSYYSYLLSNPDNLDILNGIDSNNVSLAYFASYDMVISYVENHKKVVGFYNESSKSFINFATSLLNPKCGWITRNPQYRYKLLNEDNLDIEDLKSWQIYCETTRVKLNDFFKYEIKSNMRMSRDSKARSLKILELDYPIFAVRYGLEFSYDNIRDNWSHNINFALRVQSHVLIFMLCCFPLRVKNWTLLQSMQKMSDKSFIKKSNNGDIILVIKVEELKNHRSSLFKGKSEIKLNLSSIAKKLDMSKHLDILESFIKELRPLISSDKYFFNIRRGSSFVPATKSGISNMVFRWTKMYLSTTSKFPSGIPGLPPFRPHIFRSIVATHYIKHGYVKMAAYALTDSEITVQNHYVNDDFDSKIDREIRKLDFSEE